MLTAKLQLIALTATVLLCVAGYAQSKPEALAQKSDEAWLALIDTGRYAESWKAASAMFQVAVSEKKMGGPGREGAHSAGQREITQARKRNRDEDTAGCSGWRLHRSEVRHQLRT